jgi:SAM-dependent methyltransferase
MAGGMGEARSREPEELKAAVRRYWDGKASGKAGSRASNGREFYEAIDAARYALEFHIPAVAEFDRATGKAVLEVGGGTGTDGRQLAKRAARYVDADLSFNSLSIAKDGFAALDCRGAFVQSDAERLPFCDESFDLVFSHGVLHHTPDTEEAIREVHRVLRPGGRAIVMLYARHSLSYWVGAQTLGRLRLLRARRRMGREAFNRFVGLPVDRRGWLPDWVVVNNSTDGLGNPLSKVYTARQLRQMFSMFRDVTLEKHFLPRHKIPVIGPRLPRAVAYWLGRWMGMYWYVKAAK